MSSSTLGINLKNLNVLNSLKTLKTNKKLTSNEPRLNKNMISDGIDVIIKMKSNTFQLEEKYPLTPNFDILIKSSITKRIVMILSNDVIKGFCGSKNPPMNMVNEFNKIKNNMNLLFKNKFFIVVFFIIYEKLLRKVT